MILRRLFGGRAKPPSHEAAVPDAEALARGLLARSWQCGSCREWHNGLMDIGCLAPDPWPHDRTFAPNSALDLEGDFLSEDFCVIGGQYFLIRCVLEIPVHGFDAPWGFGCWSTLKRENFEQYVADFDEDQPHSLEPRFGWMCNQLKLYYEGGDGLAVQVCPQPNRQRPRLHVKDPDHPLAIAQREGITAQAMVELLGALGHGPTLQ